MKRFGVTTIARWMTEPLPKSVRAYMVSQGLLCRLKRIRSYNGSIRPVLVSLLDGKLGGEFTCRQSKYTLDSTVFLSTGVDLAGIDVKDVMNSVAPACSDCWALQDEAVRASATDEREALRQVAAENPGWFGSQFDPLWG